MDFYRGNYIEGLFLSSGIQSSDYTMEMLVQVARSLREEHRFGGYIHLKTIPDAASELLAEAARWADRLNIKVKMPTEDGLKALAPEKYLRDIRRTMGRLRLGIEEAKTEKKAPRFAPAGQSSR
jgi:predicted DNA-binding helix-hairpin-helix protein